MDSEDKKRINNKFAKAGKKALHIGSVIHWVAVSSKLPTIEKNVIVACKDGYVGEGMISNQVVYERDENRLYKPTDKRQIEWGIEENDFEYWHELKDVLFWAEYPKPPYV